MAIALSPSGAVTAVGGRTGSAFDGSYCVYCFATTTGEIVRRIGGLGSPVCSLDFSPDGKTLAVGLNKNGLRVIPMEPGGRDWVDPDFKGAVYGLSFSSAGDLAASSLGGSLKVYRNSSNEGINQADHRTEKFYRVAFSRDGSRLATSQEDSPRIDLVDVSNLDKVVTSLGGEGKDTSEGGLYGLAWADDGSIYAAGKISQKGHGKVLRRWTQDGSAHWVKAPDLGISLDTVYDLKAVGRQGVAFAAADGLGLSLLGQKPKKVCVAASDFRDAQSQFWVSEDGKRVAFDRSYHYVKDELRSADPSTFNISQGCLTAGLATAGLHRPVFDKVTGKESSELLAGKDRKADPYEVVKATALDGSSGEIALGTNFGLKLYKISKPWSQLGFGTCWAVNFANPDLIVAAFSDGTLRWFRTDSPDPILSFYCDPAGKRWVLFNSAGYYDCSFYGWSFIGWSFSNGATQSPDFYPARNFQSERYLPNLGELALAKSRSATLSPDLLSGDHRLQELSSNQGPSIVISDFRVKSGTPPQGTVHYLIRSKNKVALASVSVLVDGVKTIMAPLSGLSADRTDTTPLPSVKSKVGIVAVDSQGHESFFAQDQLVSRLGDNAPPPVPPPSKRIGRLFLVAVGVGAFKSADLDPLPQAEPDVLGLVKAFQGQQNNAFLKVIPMMVGVPPEAATTKKVNSALGSPSQGNQINRNDILVLYLAGHGATDTKGQYFYAPYDFDAKRLGTNSVRGSAIENFIKNSKCRTLVLLDTCHAGAALGQDFTGLASALSRPGVDAVVITACTKGGLAYESADFNHGIFTKAIIEALQGANGKPTLNVLDLYNYVYKRVNDLSGDRQFPDMIKPGYVDNYTVATFAK